MSKNNNHTDAHYGLFHNPGYDFLRLIYWMKEEQNNPSPTIAPYFLPVLALLGACFSIDGYINMVGQKTDSDWLDFDKGPTPIKERIGRIYSKLDKPVKFDSGIWQKVLLLFKARTTLVHPRYIDLEEIRDNPIPDVFDETTKNFPILKTQAIAQEAIDTLLADANLSELRHFWELTSYSGPPREE